MATKNARYMVTVNDEIALFLDFVSKKKNKSVSSLIMDLIEEAIDLREDHYLSKRAEESEKLCEGRATIPASEVWEECGLT